MLCECGCEMQAPVARVTKRERGQIKGEPVRFLRGHQGRKFHIATIHEYGIRSENGCLLWRGATKGSSGYAAIYQDGRMVRVSRIVLAKKIGRELRNDEEACHSCDNPACFEAEHLFAASHRENMLDAAAKGRMYRGGRVARKAAAS